jgi:hypothetical protein
VALQAQPALIRSTTLFYWWPKRLHKRHVPKRNEYDSYKRRRSGYPSAVQRSSRSVNCGGASSRASKP